MTRLDVNQSSSTSTDKLISYLLLTYLPLDEIVVGVASAIFVVAAIGIAVGANVRVFLASAPAATAEHLPRRAALERELLRHGMSVSRVCSMNKV